MKKLFSVFLLIITIQSFGQTPARKSGFTQFFTNNQYNRLWSDSMSNIAVRDTIIAPIGLGETRFRLADTSVYVCIDTTSGHQRWSEIKGVVGAGGADGNNYPATISFLNNRLTISRNGTTSIYGDWDSTIYHSSDYYNSQYAFKVHSHSGLTPIGGSTGQVLKKVSGTDYDYTWANDNGGLTGADTLNLSNRINQKVDSVTTNSDSTILRYWVAGSSYDFYNFKTGLTGGDTTIFQTVIDSTAQSGQKILWGANNKIRSSQYLLFDSANRKVVIGNKNISVGGPNTKLWVTGNANITGNITANSFIKTGATSSQFLKADGSVDNNTYIKPADTTNKWVGYVYKRLDSFFYKTGTTEYFIGKDSVGAGGASTAAGVTPAIQLKDISSTRYAYLNRSISDGGESSPSIPAYNFQTLNSFTIPSDWWDGTSLHNLGDTALVLRLGWKTSPVNTTDSMYISKDGGVTWSFLGLFPYKVHTISNFKTLGGKFVFIGGDIYSSNADNQKVTVTNDFVSFITKTTSSPFTRRVLFSSFEGYDGAWYAVGGQANTTGDTLYNDAYRSLDSGATWSLWANQLHSGSDSIGGGNAYGQIIPFNGFYVSVGVGVYKATQKHTRKCYISPDVKTWYAIDDMPWAADYKAVWVNDGKLWVYGGNDSTGNTNNLAYLDKSFHWHSIPNYQGTDKTVIMPTSHAQATTVYRGDAILSVGNLQNKTIRLYRDIYQSAANFRDTIKVNGRTYLSQSEGAHTSWYGNGVRAGIGNNTYTRTKSELSSYFAQSYNIGQWWGFNADSAVSADVPYQVGMQMLLDNTGKLKLTSNSAFSLGTQKFQVDGKIAGNNTIESSFYANANPHLILSNTNGVFDWVTNGTANQVLTMNGTATGFQFQTLSTLGASSFILNQNSTPQSSANFYIDGNGRLANLGINTAPSTTYILDVNKASGSQIARFANASSGYIFGADANGGYIQPTASGYGVWLYNGAGTTVFKVLGAGGFSLTGGVAKYSANYGGSYDARSLVDKNYVDSSVNKRVDSIWRVAGKDSIFFSINGVTYKIKDSTGGGGGGVSVLKNYVTQTTSTGSGTTDNVTVVNIPANTLSTNGDGIEIEAAYQTTGSDTKSVDMTIGSSGSIVATPTSTTAGTYVHKIKLYKTASGSAIIRAETWRDFSMSSFSQTIIATFDWTSSQDLKISLTSTTAASITINYVSVKLVK